MAFHAFRNNYHDADLESFQLGPEQKLSLDVRLWGKDGAVARIEFQGIENYDEVSSFFHGLTTLPNIRAIDEIMGIKRVTAKSWILGLSHNGSISIRSSQCREI